MKIDKMPKKLLEIYGESLQVMAPSTPEYIQNHDYMWCGMQELKPAIKRDVKYIADGQHCGNECLYVISYLDGKRHVREIYIKKAKGK